MNHFRSDADFGWPRLSLVVAATLFAGWFTSRAPTNVDVSWYITVCERLLSGATMGVDVIETNPPASIWLYVPAVAFARAVGLKPEYAVIATTLLTMALTCALTWRLLRADDEARRVWRTPLILGAVLVFCFLPGPDFAQREHFAAMLALPFVACAMLRARELAPERAMAVAAGVCGGLAFVIKPHFGLALAPPVMLAFIYRRGWSARAGWSQLLSAENLAAGGVALFYLAAVLLFARDYLELLPLLVSLYAPLREPLRVVLRLHFILWVVFVLALSPLLFRPSRWATPPGMLLAASLGFMAACYIQAKGWRYQYVPALSMAFLALVLAAAQPGASRIWKGACAATLAMGFAGYVWWGLLSYFPVPELARMIAAARPGATVALLSDEMVLAHPSVREAGGRFIGRMPSQWVIGNHARLRILDPVDAAAQAERDGYRGWARDLLLEDIRAKKPDLLIVQTDPVDWLEMLTKDDPDLAAALAAYRPSGPEFTFSFVRARLYERTGGGR